MCFGLARHARPAAQPSRPWIAFSTGLNKMKAASILILATTAWLPSVSLAQRSPSSPRVPATSVSASTASVAALDGFLRILGVRSDAALRRTPAAKLALSDSPMNGFLRWHPDTGTRKPFVLQRDSALRSPMAAVGDTVFVYDDVMQAPVAARVLARQAFRVAASASEDCGGNTPQSNGWAYAVSGPIFDEEQAEGWAPLVLPGRIKQAGLVRVSGTSRAPMRGALRVILDSVFAAHVRANPDRAREEAATVRSEVYGDREWPVSDSLPIYQVIGPGGRRFFVTEMTLRDDYYVDGGTSVLLMFDSTGKIVGRRNDAYTIRAIGDLNGDGVQEIIFSDGIGAWDGARWLLPTAAPAASMC